MFLILAELLKLQRWLSPILFNKKQALGTFGIFWAQKPPLIGVMTRSYCLTRAFYTHGCTLGIQCDPDLLLGMLELCCFAVNKLNEFLSA